METYLREMKMVRNLFLLIIGLLVFAGCSRDLGDQSQVKLDLNKVLSKPGASSTPEVTFVAVNVSGPGMERKTFAFDPHDGCGGCDDDELPPAPTAIEIEVPNGPGRLIQLLVILETEDATGNESEVFSYGELTTDLNGGVVPVQLAMTSMGGSTNKEGEAAGRYLFADGSAFTGEVALEFKPPGGSPEMEIFKLNMFNGWFNIFLLDNIDLTYRMDNGHIMFGGPVNQSSAVFNGNDSVKKIITPKTFESDGDIDEEEMLAIGFFKGGQPDTTKNVCHDPSPETIENTFLNLGLTNSLDWPGDFTISGSQTCSLADPIVTNSQIRTGGELIDDSNGVPFTGPYAFFDNGDHYGPLSINHSGNTLTVGWQYLPGVVNSKMVGSTAFFIVEPGIDEDDFVEGGQGADCDSLVAQGFIKKTVNGSTNSVNFTVNGTDLQDTKVIICPRKANGKHFSAAIETRCLGGGCGDEFGFSHRQFEFVASGGGIGSQPPSTVDLNSCNPIDVIVVENGDSLFNVDSNLNVSLGNSGSGSFFHIDDTDCDGAPSLGSPQIPAGQNRLSVRFSSTADNEYNDLTAAEGSPFDQGINVSNKLVAVASSTNAADGLSIVHEPGSTVAAGYCYAIVYSMTNSTPSGGGPGILGSPVTFDINVAGALSGTFHANDDCSDGPLSTTGTMQIPAGENFGIVFFKPSGSSTGTVDVTGTSPSVGTISSSSITVGPNTPSFYGLSTSGSYTAGFCESVNATAQNAIGAFLFEEGENTLSLSSPQNASPGTVLFHRQPDCSDSPITEVDFSGGEANFFYIVPVGVGTVTIDVQDENTIGGSVNDSENLP